MRGLLGRFLGRSPRWFLVGSGRRERKWDLRVTEILNETNYMRVYLSKRCQVIDRAAHDF